MRVRGHLRVRNPERELEEVVDKESRDNYTRLNLVSSREGGAPVIGCRVGLRLRGIIFQFKHRTVPDMDCKGRNQDEPASPDYYGQRVQGYDIGIERVGEDGRVSNYVKDDEKDQDLS